MMLSKLREHAETAGARGLPKTKQILLDAANRIEALEEELLRLMDVVVGEEDYVLIGQVLKPELDFTIDSAEE